jgi:peptidoglycan hydrolase CwlO-like protein
MEAIDTVQLSDNIGDNISDAIETIVDFSADIVNDAVVTETRCDKLKARVEELEAQLETSRQDYTNMHDEYILAHRQRQETEEATLAALNLCQNREQEFKDQIKSLQNQVQMYNLQYMSDRQELRKTPGSSINPIVIEDDDEDTPSLIIPPSSPLLYHTPVDSEWDEYEDEDIHAQ